ncbi:MAG: aldolase/citrate lyase family protein [Bdellovibrionota bacterium]
MGAPAIKQEPPKQESKIKIDISKHKALIQEMNQKRKKLLKERNDCQADLPLRYLRQSAHFTTPASNFEMISKAVAGMASAERILTSLGISFEDIANTIGQPVDRVKAPLSGYLGSPLVMVDGEDAQALDPKVLELGRENAIRAFTELDWQQTLAFYRPSGILLEYSAFDLVTVFTETAKRVKKGDFPIHGIIWPKVEHPSEIEWVCELLAKIEKRIGLKENTIRLEFLIESGWGVANMPGLVRSSAERLAGLIWGIADYSADTNLPEIDNNNPVCDWVRMEIVNICGGVNVPAIDNMTLNYPVKGKNLSDADNKKKILGALKEVYEDTLHGIHIGMSGKWVGHPLQLFMVMIAYGNALRIDIVEKELKELEEYEAARKSGLGAAMIAGKMADRATDRHVRNRLRKAIALGQCDAKRGLDLSLITQKEFDQLKK